MFWVAGLTSEAARRIDCRVRCADRRPHNHLERCGLSRGSIVTLDDSEQMQQDGLTIGDFRESIDQHVGATLVAR